MKIKHSISQTLTLRDSAPLREKKLYLYSPTPIFWTNHLKS